MAHDWLADLPGALLFHWTRLEGQTLIAVARFEQSKAAPLKATSAVLVASSRLLFPTTENPHGSFVLAAEISCGSPVGLC